MPTIEQHFNSIGRTEREAFVSGSTVKRTYQAHIATFYGHVQPTSPTLTQDLPGSFGKSWVMLCPVIDIKEGDKVIINNTTYKVDGVEKFDFKGKNLHMEVTMRAFSQ